MKPLTITCHIAQRNGQTEKYLNEISRYRLLSAEEEAELAVKIRNNDDDALEKLVTANLRFVVSIAKQYQNERLSLNDLINEGNLGLIRAAQKFDETRGFKFISYAVWWVRQAIIQAIGEQSLLIKIPTNRRVAYARIKKEMYRFEQQYHHEPTVEELMQLSGVTKNMVHCYFRHSRYTLSTHTAIANTHDTTLKETLYDVHEPDMPERLDKKAIQHRLNAMLKTLPPREHRIITSYFGFDGKDPMTLGEIGGRLNLTQERVRQIKEKCIGQLKQQVSPAMLQVYH